MDGHGVKIREHRTVLRDQNVGVFEIAVSDAVYPQIVERLNNLADHIATPLIDDSRTLALAAVTARDGQWQALGLRELEAGVPYDQRRYAYYHYSSPDAHHWTLTKDEPVLRPEPDSRSLSGGRWLYEDGWYYLVYGGTSMRDYPDHFGLARSRDLLAWEKYPEPVFRRGEAGQWDDGGIWVGEVAHVGETYYLWYEGRGAGRSRSEEYAPGGYSQIGLDDGRGLLRADQAGLWVMAIFESGG